MSKYIIELDDTLYEDAKKMYAYGFTTYYFDAIANGAPYEERPQGEWLYNDNLNMYYCKDCGLLEPFTKEEIEDGCKLPNFCQQCGADMRGKENE